MNKTLFRYLSQSAPICPICSYLHAFLPLSTKIRYNTIPAQLAHTSMPKELFPYIPPPIWVAKHDISRADAQEMAYQTAQVLEDYQNIIAGARGFGAGHERQAEELAERNRRLKIRSSRLSLDMTAAEDPLTRLFSVGYKSMQNHPRIYDAFTKYVFNHLPNSFYDNLVDSWGNPEELMEQIYIQDPNFDPQQNTYFETTHSKAAMAVYKAIAAGYLFENKVTLNEYIPDPWDEAAMKTMSIPGSLSKHFRTVHNVETARTLVKIKRFCTAILAFGTLSNPHFLLDDQPERDTHAIPHIGFELSGNPIDGVDNKIIQALIGGQELIRQNQIEVTIHAMHHPLSYQKFINCLKELGLENHPNVRVIGGGEMTLFDAIDSRERYITGKDIPGYRSFRSPDVVISKAGEVTLEDRGNMLIIFIWGEGHEKKDGLVGVEEQRAIDGRKIRAEKLLFVARDEIKEKRPKRNPPRSVAVFAPSILSENRNDIFYRVA